MDEFTLSKVLYMRFIRGAIAGAASNMLLITFNGQNTWGDLSVFLSALTVSLVVGAITGALLAVDKFFRVE